MNIIVKDQLISYDDQGSGKTLLLLHGWGMNLHTFDELTQALIIKHYRVIRIDFPGFGGSPKPADSWHVDEYARLVTDVLRKLKVDSLYAVVGHSFGGRVILKGVGRNYFHPEKIILIGSAGVKPAANPKKTLFGLIAKMGKFVTAGPLLRGLRPKLQKKLYQSVGSSDYLQAGDLRRIFLNVINEDLLEDAHNIKLPVLLIWGENDMETPVADARKIQAAIDNSKLQILSNAGHFVYNDRSGDVVKELEEFLK